MIVLKKKEKGKQSKKKSSNDEIKIVYEGVFLNNEIISGISYFQVGNSEPEHIEIIKPEKNEKKEVSHLNCLKDGKRKEYDLYGNLIYEGEFLKGKRNGKGKEYDARYNSKVIFEGEYLNGERNGKGKEYECFDNLVFEGEYLNGKKNGKGKEYCKDKIRFEGEYYNG